MSAPHPLVDLLSDLFQAGELIRFLEHAGLRRQSLSANWEKEGIYSLADRAVEELTSEARLDDTFFDLLVEQRPEREDDIRQVQHQIARAADTEAGEAPSSPAADGAPPVDPKEAEKRRTFRERLQRGPRTKALTDEAFPWIEAAAVLDAFDPKRLRPLGPGGRPDLARALHHLAPHVVERADGGWVLSRPIRADTLKKLNEEGRVEEALAANPALAGPRTRVLSALIAGDRLSFERMSLEELLDVEEVLTWIDDFHHSHDLDRERLQGFVERRRTMAPLQRLVRNFRGRQRERRRLRSHVEGSGCAHLVLWGPGGIGKSALLGDLLLNLERAELPIPWVYLDFDDPALDPRRPEVLAAVMARQLGLLYATRRELSDGFLELESSVSGDRLSFAMPRGTEPEDLAPAISEYLQQLPFSDTPPFLVVLDTFEQVQVQGRSAVDKVRELLDAISSHWPRTRLLTSGRADVAEWSQPERLNLKGLDDESADAVLLALGVHEPRLRRKIVTSLGRSPLTLHFAAEAYRRSRGDPSALAGLAARAGETDEATPDQAVIDEAREIEVQQQLYTRILSALPPRLEKLAHPGLIVRRVTPEVIESVLAEPCGVDPSDAPRLFEDLAERIDLFERVEGGGALRHRPDVREMMLRSMVYEGRWQDTFSQIHAAAILFYRDGDDLISRAETVYHLLASDASVEELDRRWSDDLLVLLSSAWNEPLSEAARAWLAPRIGRSFDEETARMRDWEVSAAREARKQLEAGDARGALSVLRRRDDRTRGSELHRLEAEALTRLGRLDEAREVTERALEAVGDDYGERQRLMMLRIRIGIERGDLAEVRAAAEPAIVEARRRNDQAAELEALALRHRALQHLSPEAAGPAADELTESFLSADEGILFEKAPLSTRIMLQVGGNSANVLKKGALVLGGDVSDRGTFKRDVFKLGRLMESVEGAEQSFSDLAVQVGLPREGFEFRELAGQAVRYGRLGQALSEVLERAGDEPSVRTAVLDMIRPGTEQDV